MRRFSFIPLAIGLMLFPSVIWMVVLTDGPDTEYFGFPLPWNSRSIVTSMAKEVYILPLAFDFSFYAFLGFFVWRRMHAFLLHTNKIISVFALFLIWFYGLIASLYLCLRIAMDTDYQLWYPNAFRILALQFGFGI